MKLVDLNIDLGELPGESDELYALATVVNVACGGHTGDAASMGHAVRLAIAHGARLAAHPSYPDPDHFGRARMAIPLSMLYESIVDQVSALAQIVRETGGSLWGVKPHGALYHAGAENPEIAAAVLDAVVAAWPDRLVVVGPPWGHWSAESHERQLPYAREGFADRGYRDGKLIARGDEGDLVEDAALCREQALNLARSGDIESLCVHGDAPGAVAIAREVRRALEREGLLHADHGA
ncbi:MAG TPA: LamB/YcsF family protein [Polyangiaceae bacterium]|nr:LamB/YcsF family protein [Polyangiaceae bacterium]